MTFPFTAHKLQISHKNVTPQMLYQISAFVWAA